MKKILFMALAVVTMMTSCSKEDGNGGGNEPGTTGKAYLALNLSGLQGVGTRAIPTTGSGQDAVNDITIVLLDASDKILEVKKMTPSEFTYSATDASYRTTAPFVVDGATQKVFVVVNNKKGETTDDRFAFTAGDNWTVANGLKEYATTEYNVNAFINDYTGQRDGKDNFCMVNYGVRFIGAPVASPDPNTGKMNTADNGLVGVVLGKTPAEATTNANAATNKNTIYVDRLAAKVDLSLKSPNVETPNGLAFHFQGWEMNATNRKMRIYSKHDVNYTPFYSMNSAYRMDENYTLDTYGASPNVWTGYESQFTFLRNIGHAGATSTDGVAKLIGEVAYCPENTMGNSDAQVKGATTKIVIKGNYVPTGFTADQSYFSYQGVYYKLEDVKTKYATSVADGHHQGFAKDMDLFMIGAKLVTVVDKDNLTDQEKATIESAVANLAEGAAPSGLNAETGIIGRVSNSVRYFHHGVSYYDVLIKHDPDFKNLVNGFAEFGVVRNNWYKLTLNKVSRPGTPWIPGGPEDPDTKPETPDEEDKNYLDVTIAINPWVQWSQGIDL